MDADNSIETWKALGQSHSSTTAFDTGTDRNNTCHPRLCGSRNHSLQIRFKIWIIEMSVGIDQFHGEGEIIIGNAGRQE